MFVHSLGSRLQLALLQIHALIPVYVRTFVKITVRTVTNPCFDPRLCSYIPQAQDYTRTVTKKSMLEPRLYARTFLRLKISAALLQIHGLIHVYAHIFFSLRLTARTISNW
jgi:hypothetical protein